MISSPYPTSTRPSNTPTTSAPNNNHSDANSYYPPTFDNNRDTRTSANKTSSKTSTAHGGKLVLAITVLTANMMAIILLAVAVACLYKKKFTKIPTTSHGTATVDMPSVDLTDTTAV